VKRACSLRFEISRLRR